MHSLLLTQSAAAATRARVTAAVPIRVATAALLRVSPTLSTRSRPANAFSQQRHLSSALSLSPNLPSRPATNLPVRPIRRTYSSDPSLDDAQLDAAFLAGTPISGAELALLVQQGRTGVDKSVLLVDVRNPDEHAATGLIPTAVPLPLPELQAALQQPSMQFQLLNGFPKPSREATNIVVYCKAGVRADMAANVARSLGFKRVRSYKGSWMEWSDKYANVVPESPTSAPSSGGSA